MPDPVRMSGMDTEKSSRKLLTLFLSMLKISSFTFGGGFVIVNFMKRRFVEQLGWLDDDEMMDMIAIAQSCPGPIAVNAAIQVGYKVHGLTGMLVAVAGTIIPPLVILSVISLFYRAFAANRYVRLVLKGMKAGVAAVILDVVCSLGLRVVKEKSWFFDALMVAAFLVVYLTDVNVVFVILAGALLGLARYAVGRRRSA